MSNGTLHVHLVDDHGASINGTVVAKMGSDVETCTADGGTCVMSIPQGIWVVSARTFSGSRTGGPVSKSLGANGYLTIVLMPTPGYEEPAVSCPPCAACPPCPATALGQKASTTLYGSSTKTSGISRIRVGGMNMGNCRWIPSSVTPSGSLNPDGTVNWAAFSTGDQAVLIVGKENYDKIVEAVVLDIVNQGEDAADASAIAGGSQISVMQDNVNSKYYAVADSTKAGNAYIGFFELKCGAALNYPFMIGGAVVLGGIGFALGGKLGKGKHKALLGALVGSAAGVGAGLLAAKLATPSYMKAAGLGAVQARCQPGTRWSHALKRCVSPQRDPWA